MESDFPSQNGNGSHIFCDVSKEKSIVSAIAAARFDDIPESKLVPAIEFTDLLHRRIYSLGLRLRRQGIPVCQDSVNDLVRNLLLEKEIQEYVDPTKVIHWSRWPEIYSQETVARNVSTYGLEYSLAGVHECAGRRELKETAESMLAGELDRKTVIAHLQELDKREPFDLSAFAGREFNLSEKPPQQSPVFRMKGQIIGTAGNILAIQSHIKGGKSGFIGAMIAGLISENSQAVDCLGLECTPSQGKAIIHLETEMGRYHSWKMLETALRRAHLNEKPDNLKSYFLTDLDATTKRNFLEQIMRAMQDALGGIACVLIDGVGDLVASINDPEECNAFVANLHTLAIEFDCSIVVVIHENPGVNDTGKTRGHLGSQIQRKAETNLRLMKDRNDQIFTAWIDDGRTCSIPQHDGIKFAWDNELAMHVSLTDEEADEIKSRSKDVPKVTKASATDAEVKAIFTPWNGSGLSWIELTERIRKHGKLTDSGARNKVNALLTRGLIHKDQSGKYYPKIEILEALNSTP